MLTRIGRGVAICLLPVLMALDVGASTFPGGTTLPWHPVMVDLDVYRRATEVYSWVGEDFDSVRGDIEWTMRFTRGDWSALVSTRTALTTSATEFRLHAELDAHLDGERVFSKNWDRRIPRDHV